MPRRRSGPPEGTPDDPSTEVLAPADAERAREIPDEVLERHKRRHTGRQRLLLGVNLSLAFACLASGGGMLYANYKLGQRKVVTIDTVPPVDTGALDLPAGDLSAKNYLLTGTDNNACVDANSPYAGAVGNRKNYGTRSDTIMVVRVNPIDNQVAILSFPRDLWVKIDGSNAKSRINAAYDPKNPNRLIRTIKNNFDISINHFVSVDFCTFKTIVDAVGGIRVPFLFRTRDERTGLAVPGASCFEFTGDHALAYVRSRHYKFYDPAKKTWKSDGLSDWGRISRQQDFVRRITAKSLEKAKTNPKIASEILNAALKNVVTDDQLTPLRLLQLGQAMKNYDADTMGTYTFRAKGLVVGDKSVLEPDFEDETMQKILLIFQGKARIQLVNEATTTVPATAPPATGATTGPVGATTTPRPVVTTTTLPAIQLENNQRGIVPPNDASCRY